METKQIKFIKNNIKCSGSGDFFDKNDALDFNSLFFDWKEYNEKLVKYGSRRTNYPEILSEGLFAYLTNYCRTNNKRFTGLEHSSFDCINPDNGETYQIKAVSTFTYDEFGGPTSFGPKSEWDKLIVIHIVCENNTAYFYEVSDNIELFKVNKNQTFKDQCIEGRRPRFNILKEIKNKHMDPFMTYTFKREVK